MTMTPRRGALIAAAAGLLITLAGGPAAAHVTVKPAEAAQGGYQTLTFQVPNEDDEAATTELQVTMPTDAPITSVSVQPRPGWSYDIERQVLDEPIQTGHGEVTEVVSTITWTADDPDAAIAPGEFDTFLVSAGPLPTGVDTLIFPAVQTYSDGQVVSWIETAAPGAPTPDHPAPALTLVAGQNDDAAHSAAADNGADDSDTALVVAGVGLAVAIVAAGAAGTALLRRR